MFLTKKENMYLKVFRYLFMVDINQYDKVVLNKTTTKKVLHDLLDYIKEKYSFKKWNGEELYFNSIK